MAPSTLTPRAQFRQTVAEVAARAKARLPECNGRVEKATALVLSGDVTLHADGTATVFSATDPTRRYELGSPHEGYCMCKDWEAAPQHLCKHRLAAMIALRAQQARPPALESEPEPSTDPAPPASGIDPRHVVTIQGKPFVKFAGLLDLAHRRGLQSLTVAWTSNEAELSLAHAVAVFPFGTFEESGDATPANVNHKVAPHFRRCALTRAKARVLRDALDVDMVAVEELSDE